MRYECGPQADGFQIRLSGKDLLFLLGWMQKSIRSRVREVCRTPARHSLFPPLDNKNCFPRR